MFPKQEQGIKQKSQSHRFLAKPKMIVAGGLGGGVSHPGGPRQCLGESACVKPPEKICFLLDKK